MVCFSFQTVIEHCASFEPGKNSQSSSTKIQRQASAGRTGCEVLHSFSCSTSFSTAVADENCGPGCIEARLPAFDANESAHNFRNSSFEVRVWFFCCLTMGWKGLLTASVDRTILGSPHWRDMVDDLCHSNGVVFSQIPSGKSLDHGEALQNHQEALHEFLTHLGGRVLKSDSMHFWDNSSWIKKLHPE